MTYIDPTDLSNFDPSAGEMTSHYSALTLHRKCAQAWYYRYGLGLERLDDTPSPERELGIWWSVFRAVESLARGRRLGSLLTLPRELKAADVALDPKTVDKWEVLEVADLWWERQSHDTKDAWNERLGVTNLADHLEQMYDRWHAAYGDQTRNERPLGVEVFWKRPLPRPKQDAQWSLANFDEVPQLHLLGYIDELYVDTARDNMIVVRDHKTSKTLDASTSLEDVFDPQLPLYVWGIAPFLKRHDLPAPRAIAYDRIRSKAPTEPVLTATGLLNKSKTDYDLQTYSRWAQTDTRPSNDDIRHLLASEGGEFDEAQYEALKKLRDELPPGQFWGRLGEFYASGAKKGRPKFGVYEVEEKEVERLSHSSVTSRWVDRTLDPVNVNVLKAHLRSAVDTAMDIWQTQMRAAETGGAARSYSRMGCSFCDYASLCRAQMVGGPRGEYDLAEHGLRVKEGRA